MQLDMMLTLLGFNKNTPIKDVINSLVIYLRKSRKDAEFCKDEPIEKTLERHEKELQTWITNIFGIPIPEKNIYREVASGDTIVDRPIMTQLLDLIKEDNSKRGVVCIEIERLARGNTIDQGIIAETFKYSNTKILTPMKIYDLDNKNDAVYFEDGLYQSRKYLQYVKEILSRGRRRSVADGKYTGSIPPYGYNKMKLLNEKGFTLVENKDEKEVTILIADTFINGLYTTYKIKNDDTISSVSKIFGISKKELLEMNENINFAKNEILKINITDPGTSIIANYLNFLNIKPRNSEQWTANMIRNILLSYATYGYVTWNHRKEVKIYKNKKLIKTRPYSEDFIISKGIFKPILSEEKRKLIMEKFKRRSTLSYKERDLKNPLVGIIECGYCGRKMTRRPYRNSVIKGKLFFSKDERIEIQSMLFNAKIKNGLTNRDIANKLSTEEKTITRDMVSSWVSSSQKRFRMPSQEIWNKLKIILNIKNQKYDTKFNHIEKEYHQVDSLICKYKNCKCVSSKLYLVEEAIIKKLRMEFINFKTINLNYEKELEKIKKNNESSIILINNEIKKIELQIEKACDLVETGIYTKDIYISRVQKLNIKLNELKKKRETLLNNEKIEKELEQRKQAIPIFEEVLKKYNTKLTPAQKNKLLKSIVDKVIYTKSKGGRGFEENFNLIINIKL